jgi:hypothetical protein
MVLLRLIVSFLDLFADLFDLPVTSRLLAALPRASRALRLNAAHSPGSMNRYVHQIGNFAIRGQNDVNASFPS